MQPLLRLLWPFYRRYALLGLAGVLAVAAVNFLAVLPGWVTGRVIDHLSEVQRAASARQALMPILAYLGGLALLMLLRAALMVAMRLSLVVLSRRVERDHRAYLLQKLLQWDLLTLHQHPTGELLTHFTEDLNRLRNFTGPVVLYGLQTIFLVLFTGALMFYTEPRLALFTLLPLVLIGPLTYLLRREALSRGHRQQQAFAAMSAFLQQVYPFLRPLRAIADPSALAKEWHKRTQAHRQASLSVARIEAYLHPLTLLFVGISLTVVLIYGGIRVTEGKTTVGTIGAFSLYVVQLMFPLSAVGWLISLVQQARASAERLLALQAVSPRLRFPAVSLRPPAHHGWAWEALSFRYSPDGPFVLSGLRGKVAPGEKIAFSLPMGSGKTTLARLLSRHLDPTEGEIWFGGVPLPSLSWEDLRQRIGYVPQQPFLLSGSLAENLRLVRPEASQRELWQALEWAGLAEEVAALPKGLQTDIGLWGQQVSGGQRQRLALAMTLLKKPVALILDDTFAPLDSEKVKEILTYLQRHFGHATWVIFTHRTEVQPFVDRWETTFQVGSPRKEAETWCR